MSPGPAAAQTNRTVAPLVRPSCCDGGTRNVCNEGTRTQTLPQCVFFRRRLCSFTSASPEAAHLQLEFCLKEQAETARGSQSCTTPPPPQHTSSVPSPAPPAAVSPGKHSLCKSAAATGAPLTLQLPSTDTFTRTDAAPVIANVSSSKSYRGQQRPAIQLN